MQLSIASYLTQSRQWPARGKHILAQHDAETVIVYQAYRPEVADFALEHGHFGGPHFSFSRMSWIKPNFLWMMYRCGWATKPEQQRVLALRLRRAFFDSLLERAVLSSFNGACDPAVWQAQVAASDVRLQWDPDHTPSGAKLERRALQLGLRGAALAAYARDELLEVVDMTAFVAKQREFAGAREELLQTPVEQVYLPTGGLARVRSGIDLYPAAA